MVLGPPGAFFSGNTELALVMNMCLPILMYLAREEPRRWLRLALRAAFGLTALAIPFTYSRGGIVGLAVVLGMLFLKARTRLALIPVVIAALLAFAWLAPSRWVERVETLRTYEEDQSANLRLMSWRVGYALANDRPLTGGGFKVFVNRETYDRFMPEYPRGLAHEAHSIYFGVAGEHGWIGLGIVSALIICTLGTLRWLRSLGQRHESLVWLSNYGHMLQASLVAYLVTGIFLSVAYFDLAYQLMVIAIILKGLARRELAVLDSSLSSTRAPDRPVGASLVHAAP
jgi:probable O-glycosylation ligase (exosortase A-associated)